MIFDVKSCFKIKQELYKRINKIIKAHYKIEISPKGVLGVILGERTSRKRIYINLISGVGYRTSYNDPLPSTSISDPKFFEITANLIAKGLS